MSHDFSFDCNICLEGVRGPVVTLCGHLFCGACFDRWLALSGETKESATCPVCKRDTAVIPIFGKGSSGPRTSTGLSDEGVPRSRFRRGNRSGVLQLLRRKTHPSLSLLLGMAVFSYILYNL